MPKNKNTTVADQFLKTHHFYDYQNFATYIDALDRQITIRLRPDNPLSLSIPFHQASPTTASPFLILDLGGTFLRLTLCHNSSSQPKILAEKKLDFYHDQVYTPEILITDLREAIEDFLKTTIPQIPPSDLTTIIFSFANTLEPSFKNKQLDGKILYWGKNHRSQGLLQLQLGQALQSHLREHSFEKVTVQLINDGTLLALANLATSQQGDCLIDLIVGTGTNINIAFYENQNLRLINLESGDLDFAPYSTFDLQLNHQSSSPNHFRTEKLFSGAWQNQLFQIMLEQAEKETLLESKTTLNFFKHLSSAEIETFFTNANSQLSNSDLPIVHHLWSAITTRGAALSALLITRLSLQLQRLGHLQTRLLLTTSGALLSTPKLFHHEFHQTLHHHFQTTPELREIILQDSPIPSPICQAATELIRKFI